jgi:hypothetical protein
LRAVCVWKRVATRGNSSEAGAEPKHQAFVRMTGGVAIERIRNAERRER